MDDLKEKVSLHEIYLWQFVTLLSHDFDFDNFGFKFSCNGQMIFFFYSFVQKHLKQNEQRTK